ncbi:MAG: phosphoserine phosphatase SerB [Mycobacteriales bacterium]
MATHSVLLTVTGRDRPGLTAAFFTALTAYDVDVLDVEQVVIRGRFVLGVLIALHGDPQRMRKAVEQTAASLHLEVEIDSVEGIDEDFGSPGPRHHVIVIGMPLRAGAVSEIARRIADTGGNIDSIRRLSRYPVRSLELMVSGVPSRRLRADLTIAADQTGTDIAVERAGLGRRAKRLVVLDVDSTLIQGEVIEMLADRAGVRAKVREVTAAAMAGEIDFEDSLRQRVALLAGLPESVCDDVRRHITFTPGARTLVRTLHRIGCRCGVVSGGFTQVVDGLAAELKLDFVVANTLEIADGRLTGRLVGPIIDRAGKATALRHFAEQSGVPLSQTVAVGDGANDIDMIAAAGLGIAFNAKPALQRVADTALRHPHLDAILFMLGLTREEIEDDAEGADSGLLTQR